MELEFKPDFEEVRQRWASFWKKEKTDRPLVSIVLPKPNVEPVKKPPPPYFAGSTGDYEPVIDQVIAWAKTHDFIGEAIPFYLLEFGPDHFSALLGADLEFNPHSPGTNWVIPFVKEWSDNYPIEFKRDCKWWQRTVSFIRAFRERCDGKLLLAAPTLSAGLDSLAAIRGAEKLLMDLLMEPEKVKSALEDICQAYSEILEALSIELDFVQFGSINRHGMYSTGKINVPQCDLSCMISPDMFREFAVPCLEYETTALDAVEYHLDGHDALKHLEAICKIDGIDVIQWVPGAGNEEKDWTELYRKIDNLGKGQIFGFETSAEIKHLWKELKSKKLFFNNICVTSKREAEDLIHYLEKKGK